jgi:hypothetical protein
MSSSRGQARFIREDTPGVLPAGAMQVIPFGTFGVKSSFTRGTPDDVNTHGQAEDNPAEDLTVSASGSGDFRFGIRDMPREEVFRNTFSAAVTVTSALIAAVQSGNKLTRAAGWGSRAAGDIIWVTGFVTNGAAFAAKVSAVSGADLTLAWPALQDESAGPSVTVADLGQLIFGSSILTSYGETWNFRTLKGRKHPGLSASQWDLSMTFPGHWRESFSYNGMLKAERISAQLANATTAAIQRRTFNASTNTGDKTVIGSQMGVRYGGSLLTSIILKSLKLSVMSPKVTEGGAGVLGPQDIDTSGLVTVKLDIQVLNQGSDVDTLVDDANDPNAEKSFGLGLRDADGKRVYLWLPKLNPYNGDDDGIKREGKQVVDLSYTGRFDSVDSTMRYAMLS